MSLLNYKVGAEQSNLVLNTIYAIFLGLLFTFFFDQEVEGGNVRSVNFLVDRNNWIAVSAVSVYFALDWLTTNLTVRIKQEMNHWLLMTLILLISYLGGLVVLSFSPDLTLYSLFALYAGIVPWWDLMIHAPNCNNYPISRSILIHGMILFRLIAGGAMFVVIYFLSWADKEVPEGLVLTLLVFYVFLKMVRYLLYVHYEVNQTGGIIHS